MTISDKYSNISQILLVEYIVQFRPQSFFKLEIQYLHPIGQTLYLYSCHKDYFFITKNKIKFGNQSNPLRYEQKKKIKDRRS